MKPLQQKVIDAYLASRHGVITAAAARSLGLSDDQVRWHVRTGRWVAIHRGIYRRAGEPPRPETRLLAACLTSGPTAVASHASAAWLWDLIPQAPARPTVTVARDRSHVTPGVARVRRDDIDGARVLERRAIPVTDPIRTLADLGEVVDARELDGAIDRALARRLLTVAGLEREVQHLGRRGRRGVPRLRDALERRGLIAGPHPSVLESRTMRLLRRWGLRPLGAEVAVCDGRYRLDVLLRRGVALEVDGYAFHWSPEAKAADGYRRNQLRLAGILVVEADWVTVMREPQRLRGMVMAALDIVPDAPGDPAR